jgi:glutaminyl-peptide cyclotransferase
VTNARFGARFGLVLAALLLAAPALAGCGGSKDKPPYDPAATSKAIADAVAAGLFSPKVSVLATLDHSTKAWTEGLEVADGTLYESTGLAGHSELRELDVKTGRLLRATALPDDLYGEGITVVGSLIWQLTYHDGVILQWNRETLNTGGRAPWTGEGWGLCHNEGSGELYASDGTDQIRVIDRNGVDVQRVMPVRLKGLPLPGLNELECLRAQIVANIYGTNWIVSIDRVTGEVEAAMDLSKLVPKGLEGNREQVLNGIAAIRGVANTYLVTGKFWPVMYRIRLEQP